CVKSLRGLSTNSIYITRPLSDNRISDRPTCNRTSVMATHAITNHKNRFRFIKSNAILVFVTEANL
ncbi:MAG: hypothetical protein K2L85_08505, partial [Paramuribaculum sp.]|nr:hypothetical protein [Paramuribaculum sp.]